MAKKATEIVGMKSTESCYLTTVSRKSGGQVEKLEKKMYDPRLKKHVLFKQCKINKGKKN